MDLGGASVALEGLRMSPGTKALQQRWVRGEINLEAYVDAIKRRYQLAIFDASRDIADRVSVGRGVPKGAPFGTDMLYESAGFGKHICRAYLRLVPVCLRCRWVPNRSQIVASGRR